MKWQAEARAMANTFMTTWSKSNRAMERDDLFQELMIELATKVDITKVNGNRANFIAGALWKAAHKAMSKERTQAKRIAMDLDTYLMGEDGASLKKDLAQAGMAKVAPNNRVKRANPSKGGRGELAPGVQRAKEEEGLWG